MSLLVFRHSCRTKGAKCVASLMQSIEKSIKIFYLSFFCNAGHNYVLYFAAHLIKMRDCAAGCVAVDSIELV